MLKFKLRNYNGPTGLKQTVSLDKCKGINTSGWLLPMEIILIIILCQMIYKEKTNHKW